MSTNSSIRNRLEVLVDSLPSDIDGPDAGLYLRFTWQLASSASHQLERVIDSAQACFDRANVEVKNVTEHLDRIFLLIYGD